VKPVGTHDRLRQIEALLILHQDVQHEDVQHEDEKLLSQPTHALGRHAAALNRESRRKAS
jgi:hypothetical protein